MKELSIEEKAQRYDEAIAHARLLLKTIGNATLGNLVLKNEFKTMFPALEESEDERIRKAIIEHFTGSHTCMFPYKGFTKEQILAWLEKQGEQKTEVKYVYTKFQIGDTIVENKPNGYCQPVRVKYIGDGAYSCESDDGKRSLSFPVINQDDYELVEQKPAAWSDEDESNLDLAIYHIRKEPYRESDVEPIVDWLRTLKDRVQPKQEWSEEDESMRIRCIGILGKCYMGELPTKVEEELNWLKSIRSQKQWKPSDEQMNALNYVVNLMASSERPTENDLYYNILKSLRQQLKKHYL